LNKNILRYCIVHLITNTLQFKYFQISLALFITIIVIVQSKTRHKLISDYIIRMEI